VTRVTPMTSTTSTDHAPPPPEAIDGAPAFDLRTAGDRIEGLLDELRAAAIPRIYDKAEQVLRLVTDLYGAGLARVVEVLGEAGSPLLDDLLADDLVASLLLVHGLHPRTLDVRVEAALEKVRPVLAQHGGDVELLDVDPGAAAVHLRLLGNCDGCPSSSVTLQSAVEKAILEAAPEVVLIDVDQPGSVPAPPARVGAGPVPVTLGTKPLFDECPSEVVGL